MDAVCLKAALELLDDCELLPETRGDPVRVTRALSAHVSTLFIWRYTAETVM